MSQYGTTSRETPNQGVPVWRFNNETYEVSRNIERNLMKRIYLTTALALLSSAAYAESNVNELRSDASAPTFSHSAVNPSQPVAQRHCWLFQTGVCAYNGAHGDSRGERSGVSASAPSHEAPSGSLA